LEHLVAVGAKSPWLGKGLYVSIIRLLAFLFSVRDEARGMGKASRVTTTRAVAYQRLPLLIPFLSKTEVAHCTVGDCHCGAGWWALKGSTIKSRRIRDHTLSSYHVGDHYRHSGGTV
jgi:hypothetical protein